VDQKKTKKWNSALQQQKQCYQTKSNLYFEIDFSIYKKTKTKNFEFFFLNKINFRGNQKILPNISYDINFNTHNKEKQETEDGSFTFQE
jgi:hypothetical protein